MIENRSRRIFIKKGLAVLSSLPLYSCGGGGGSGSSGAAPITPATALPVFLIQPSDQTVNPGETATFQALANGSDPISYQWLRNGVNIPGATSLSYTTPPAVLGGDALFSVSVKNDAGTVNSNEAQLTVTTALVAPSILDQPSDKIVVEGAQATFRVLAEGSPPLYYQWLRNGQPISGATDSSYTIPPVALGDDAAFSVAVTNDAGSESSLAAQLTVIANTVTVDSTIITVDSTLLTVDST